MQPKNSQVNVPVEELAPEDYVQMAEDDDATYEAKKQQASKEEGELNVEQMLSGSISGCEQAIRLLAQKVGVLAAKPDPRTYLEQLASPYTKPGDEYEEPEDMPEVEADAMLAEPHDPDKEVKASIQKEVERKGLQA